MRIVSIIITLFLAIQLQAQESQFFEAMKTKNIQSVSDLLDKRVELCINDSQELYTKKEVISRVNNWLAKVSLKSLEPIHGGESKDNASHYKVAKLNTTSGMFRVFVYVEKSKNSSVIKKIQIDPFN